MQAIRLVESSFFETRSTQKIENLKWPTGEVMLVFPQNSCLISQDECEAGILWAYKQKKSSQDQAFYYINRRYSSEKVSHFCLFELRLGKNKQTLCIINRNNVYCTISKLVNQVPFENILHMFVYI